MEKQYEIMLLERAADEIENLKRRNELLEAKQEVFDGMMSLFNISPRQYGMQQVFDTASEIKKLAQEKMKELIPVEEETKEDI